jgi:hypothetical protein
MKVGTCLGIFFLLVGCAPRQINEMSFAEVQQLGNEIKERCRQAGAGEGSPNFQLCYQTEADREQTVRQNGAIQAERARQGVAAGLAAAGQSLSDYNRQNQPIYTRCNRQWGGQVVCTTTPY